MFGVVPRQLWQRLNPPDKNNMCTWSMRCLLIETGKSKILVDTGLGMKQDEKFRSHFEPHGSASLINSLAEKGLKPKDITDVFLTHLHFDHCGGAVMKDKRGKLKPTFPKATYWSNQRHWDWAMKPNMREKASFLKENFVPLQEAGVLKMIDIKPRGLTNWKKNIKIGIAHGHTEAMMLLYISEGDKTLVYCADLLPSSFHIGLPYVMSYDLRPLKTLKEKEALLKKAVKHNYLLYFEHDPHTESATVKMNERGRIVLDEKMSVSEYFGK